MLSKYIIKLESVSSTNDYAREILKNEAYKSDIVYVTTNEQTKGRGQVGNIWESNKGENITCSIIIRPNMIEIADQFNISIAVSLAIASVLEEYLPGVSIKWPNDIYVRNNKICGILIENSLIGSCIESSIIGIGLNVNQTKFSASIPNPTSLAIELKNYFNIDDIFTLISNKIALYMSRLYNAESAGFKNEYLKKLYLKGEKSNFKAGSIFFEGIIEGINEYGMIEIRECISRTLMQFGFKEVEYIH